MLLAEAQAAYASFALADTDAALEGNREKADPAREALRCGEITIHSWGSWVSRLLANR